MFNTTFLPSKLGADKFLEECERLKLFEPILLADVSNISVAEFLRFEDILREIESEMVIKLKPLPIATKYLYHRSELTLYGMMPMTLEQLYVFLLYNLIQYLQNATYEKLLIMVNEWLRLNRISIPGTPFQEFADELCRKIADANAQKC